MTHPHSRRRSAGRFAHVTTCISTTLVLLLLGITALFVTLGTNLSRQIREGLTVEVMLHDSLTNHQRYVVQQTLRQAPYTRRTDYISKERGTREMNEALQGEASDLLGASPIPAEFEVYLQAPYANLDSLSRYEPSMRAIEGVSDVVYPRDIMESLDSTIPAVGLALLIVAALLTLVSFALINNSIRMSVYAQRFSIHTMKLVGADWSFIRRPFLSRAFGVGLVSVVIADGLLGGCLYYLQYVVGSGELYLSSLITPTVWAVTLGGVAVCGLLLTLTCAFLSVNRHLRSSESRLYLG